MGGALLRPERPSPHSSPSHPPSWSQSLALWSTRSGLCAGPWLCPWRQGRAGPSSAPAQWPAGPCGCTCRSRPAGSRRRGGLSPPPRCGARQSVRAGGGMQRSITQPAPNPPHLISLTRGMGCITTIFFLALVMLCGVRTNCPKHWGERGRQLATSPMCNGPLGQGQSPAHGSCTGPAGGPRCALSGVALTASYSCVEANRSFWMRVMYSTSVSGRASSMLSNSSCRQVGESCQRARVHPGGRGNLAGSPA